MNSLKNVFSSIVVSLAFCQFAPLAASTTDNHTALPSYHNRIGNISLSYDGPMLTGKIILENGYVLRINDYKVRDDNVIHTWKKGDLLSFKTHHKCDALVLSVLRINSSDKDKVEPYVVFDVINSSHSGLAISEINEEGKFVKLNDGSVWDFSWMNRFTTKHWKAGERVLVQGRGDKNSYEFINLDAPVKLGADSAIATFIIE